MDVTQVHAALVARFHARLPGIEFDERNLQKLAAAIWRAPSRADGRARATGGSSASS